MHANSKGIGGGRDFVTHVDNLCLSGMWLGMLQERISKGLFFKRHWITCSKYDDHSETYSQNKRDVLKK